jgi:hypothetical protein
MDGSLIIADGGNNWYRLDPDIHGSYLHGAWSRLASTADTRLYYSSQVLMNGNVYVCGAEYGTGGNKSEIYNPLTNTWTAGPNSELSGGDYIDVISVLLADGTLMQGSTGTNCQIYNPVTNSYGSAFYTIRGMDEMDWCKLPDDSILSVDDWGWNSERYIPSQGAWVADANTPVALCDSLGEIGSSNLLPNGKVFTIGATPNTAIYTPSGSSSPGAWVLGPAVPSGLGADDAPAAAENSGTLLFTLGPTGTYNGPTSFFEYDYSSNAITQINGPTGSTDSPAPYNTWMIDLPDGNILYVGSAVYMYTPSGSPLAAGKPVISSVTQNPGGSFHLVGTGLNGISMGARYGDDKQMDTNYPLVRLTSNSTGDVYYARTYNRSTTSIQTGSKTLTTEFVVPSIAPSGTYSLVAVVNGNASAPVTFSWTNPNYKITNGAHTLSPQCATGSELDDPGYNTANGTKLDIWQANSGQNQTWDFTNTGGNTYTVNVDLGTYCLDDMGGGQGTQAAVWSCNGGINQNWTALSAGANWQLQNASGQCLDVYGAGSGNGTPIIGWPCNASDSAQVWTIGGVGVVPNAPVCTDVTGQVSIARGSVLPNLSGGGYYQMVTVKNMSATSIAGPVEILLTNLTAGVSVTNASGTFNGSPYRIVTTSPIAPGASAQVRINYSNPTNVRFSYGVTAYSGPLNG